MFAAKFRWMIALLIVGGVAGCSNDEIVSADRAKVDLFAPTSMRIHPIFTQVEDWTHGGKPDGIEAQLEFNDQFGDPTKASGRVVFELFEYNKKSPDTRGVRLAGPWVSSLATFDEQRERWNTTLRTYRFQLNYPKVTRDKAYVLTAIFEITGGGRFFGSMIITPRKVGPEK